MTLTKWLCKTFDKDNKGYVEIGDISKYIPALSVGMLIVSGYVNGLYLWIFAGYSMVGPDTLCDVGNDMSYMLAIGVTGLFTSACLITSLAIVYEKIINIRIATCERIDVDEKDNYNEY